MLDAWGNDPWTPLRFSLRSKKWKYRGEGNANLVIALSQERKIVRLRKYESGRILEANEEEECERVLREAIFCRGVMVPLLGEMYIQPPTAAAMERVEVRLLDQMLRAQRPVYRHHKGLHFCHVTVYPDYALLPLHLGTTTATPTFCVEVKPKQGWIPGPDRRLPNCTFCLNQYLKLKNGSIQSKSCYCPLDLFSGNQARMKLALHMLLASPQNNLKIFVDGVLVYGEEVGGDLHGLLHQWLGNPQEISDPHRLEDKFCDLVYEALTCSLSTDKPARQTLWDGLKEMDYSSALAHCHSVTTPFERIPGALIASVSHLLPERACDWSAEPLPQDCILARILRIQKLEQSGADWIYHMHHSGGFCHGVSDYSYVSAMLKAGPNITPLHRYLLATTAKDCSIMIAFQRLDIPVYRIGSQIPACHILRDVDAQSYVFNIGVSDLDPKPLSCIEKHRKRDCEILSACLEMIQPGQSKV